MTRTILCIILLLFSLCTPAMAEPEIHVSIPAFVLQVYDNGKIIKEYPIAVGTPAEQTPIGRFKILNKIVDPTWYPGAKFENKTPVPPGPANPFGSRWMEFKSGYGIHGTNKGWDINYPVFGGCIKMQDADVRELFDLVSGGTPVTITYETMFLIEKTDGLYLKQLPDIYSRHTNTPERFHHLLSLISKNMCCHRETGRYRRYLTLKQSTKPRWLCPKYQQLCFS